MRDGGYHGVVVVGIAQHAALLEREDERHVVMSGQRLGRLRGHGVGIGVENVALAVVGQRCYDGGDACLYQSGQHVTVGTVDVAHKAEVDVAHQRALMAAYDVGVGTGQPDGVDTVCLQSGYDVLVDQSAVDHGHYLQHGLVGDAPSVHHVCLYA